MKQLAVCLFLVVAACGKANDVPALKAEAEGIAKSYQARFDDLLARANSIMQRGNAIGVTNAEAMNASRTFANAVTRVEQCDPNTKVCKGLKHDIARATTELKDVKDAMAVRRWIDAKTKEWRDAYTEINADFDAVESWITIAEMRPQQVARRDARGQDNPVVPPPPPAPAPDAVPPPPPAGTQGAGGTAPPKQ